METTAISVVIPAYNAATHLPETLQSVLQQDHVDVDIILVDDGSTDNTEDVVKSFLETGIRYYRIENSGGPSRPRNLGLQQARRELVSLFDADDIMMPGKLAAAANVFQRHPETDLLFSDYDAIDADGRLIQSRVMDTYQRFRRIARPLGDNGLFSLDPGLVYEELLLSNFIGTSSVIARRSVLEAEGGFDETLKNADDVDMWYRLARRGRQFVFIDTSYHQYRRHPSSISKRGSKRLSYVIQMLEKQKAFLCSRAAGKLLDRKLYRAHLAYGWDLRQEGAYSEATRAYGKALRQRISAVAIKGAIIATCLSVLSKRNPNVSPVSVDNDDDDRA